MENNDLYIGIVAVVMVTIVGLVTYFSQQHFLKKGESHGRAATKSAILGVLASTVVVSIGLMLPFGVALVTMLIAMIWGIIYFNAITYLRNKIHKTDRNEGGQNV